MKKTIKVLVILFAAAMATWMIYDMAVEGDHKEKTFTTQGESVEKPNISDAEYLYSSLKNFRVTSLKYLKDKETLKKLSKKRKPTSADLDSIKILNARLDSTFSTSLISRGEIFAYVDAIHEKFNEEARDSLIRKNFLGQLGRVMPGVNGSEEILDATAKLIKIVNSDSTLKPFEKHVVLLNELLYFKAKAKGI